MNLRAAILPDPSERRKKPRYAVSDVVEIYIVGPSGRYLGSGVLRDISESGAGVAMDVPVTPGTLVELMNHRGSIQAISRHNNPAFSGYMVGFEFVDGPDLTTVNTWSPLPATW